MKNQLFNFQATAVEKIYSKSSIGVDTLLVSPTGSGKTIMMFSVINRLVEQFPNATFIWITPNVGGLVKQTMDSADEMRIKTETKTLQDVLLTGGLEAKQLLVTNWEALTKQGNVSQKVTEERDSFENIVENETKKIFLFVDEEHYNNTKKSKGLISKISPFAIIRASATPVGKIKEFEEIVVNPSAPIYEGLIKKSIILNGDITNYNVKDKTEYLIKAGLEKKKELEKANPSINPLMIIQLPNNNDSVKEKAIAILHKELITFNDGRLAIHLSSASEKINNTKDILVPFDSKVDVIITKQAISMGWNVPRSQILVKLRSDKSEQFKIQTLGRINRMPERKHYDNDILNSAYVYSFDEKFNDGLLQVASNAGFSKTVNLSKKVNTGLTNEFIKKTKTFDNMDDVFKNLEGYISKTIGISKDGFERYGFDFAKSSSIQVKSAEIRLDKRTNIFKKKSLEITEKDNYLETANQYRIMRAKIGQVIGLFDRDYVGDLFKKLFIDDFKFFTKSSDLYDFLLKNEQLFLDLFGNFKKQERIVTINQSLVSEKFNPPAFKMIVTEDPRDFSDQTLRAEKSLYKNDLTYWKNISEGEQATANYLDKNENVDWWYKNDENNGQSTFGVTYRNEGVFHRFEPDFIAEINGDTWIIEVKGEKDSDKSSELKFNALKENAEKHGYEFAFVRKRAGTLRASNTKYDDDIMNISVWKEIKNLF